MDTQKLRDEVIANIRACLISIKGKCDIRQVKADYRLLMGSDIPYTQLGFKNLEQFISSIPTIQVTKGPSGQFLLEAKVDEKTSHIAHFINNQKQKRKKRQFSTSTNHSYQSHKAIITKWKPKILNTKAKELSKTPPKQSIITHNQFVKHPKHQPNLAPRFLRQRLGNDSSPLNLENPCDSVLSAAKNRIVKKMLTTDTDNFSELKEYDSYTENNLTAKEKRLNLEVGVLSGNLDNKINNKSLQESRHNRIKEEKGSSGCGDSIADLKEFARKHNLEEPIIKVKSRKQRSRKPTLYDCQIKIGDISYTSYPKDFTDEQSAQQYVAELALNNVVLKYSKTESFLLSSELDILERIPPIVEKHYHGIWNWQLEADYKDIFNEELPINWIEIIDALPSISVIPCLDDKFVLKYCKPNEKIMYGQLPLVSEVSVPSSVVKFDEDGMLIADITCAVSTTEIWCRQTNTLDADTFNTMIAKLDEYYNTSQEISKPNAINVGGFFVAQYEEANWVRVRILDVYEDDVNCFFIDYGDECRIQKSNIFQLKREFAKENAQAFLCKLHGLELLEEASINAESLQNLVGQHVQVQAVPTAEEESNIKNPAISVVMYDLVSGLALNKQLIASITAEFATPVLHKDKPTEVHVTYVAENGDIYIQVRSKALEQLFNMLRDFGKDILENKISISNFAPTPKNCRDKLFVAYHSSSDQWHRAKIIDWAPNNTYAQIYFVDIGDTDIVRVGQDFIYVLEDINDILNQYPPQAIKVRMAIDYLPSNFAEKVQKLMPPNQSVLLKVSNQERQDKIPIVEFFKRAGIYNALFPVNKSLELSEENSNISTTMSSNKLEKLKLLTQFDKSYLIRNVPSSGSLKCPPLPEIGCYFDVKVPCAVNPWNFFVQPYESHDSLSKLMCALQEQYAAQEFSPLNIDDVYPGGIYASKHDDGLWYRTSVIKVIHSGSISVFYCDFGYYGNLTLDQLMPLDVKFMDLPHQAIKAKLAGIKPKHNKWTMNDCVYFEKMVCRRNFVSILISIDKDELYRCDTVISLKLIDTSTEDDIYIDRNLIEVGIAETLE